MLRTKAENDPSTTADDVVNHRSFDSLGRLREEGFSDDSTGTKWKVLSAFDAASRRSTVTYPSFGSAAATELSYGYDDLNRVRTIVDTHFSAPDETIATFAYVGSTRMVQSTRGDGTKWTGYIGSTTSWDAAGRRTQGAVKKPDNSILFEEEIKYTIRDEVRAVIWSHGRSGTNSEAQSYGYDDLGRLTQSKQGLWDGALNSGQGDVSLDGTTTPTAATSWNLDELGNWRTLDNDLDASAAFVPNKPGADNFYTMFPTMVDTNNDGTVDTRQNLTMSKDDASGFIFRRDLRLNTTDSTAIKWLEYKHDLLGRLVEVKRHDTTASPPSSVLAQYGYDAAGRLAWRCAGECGVTGVLRKWFVYDGNQVVREGTGASGVDPDGSYVWLGSTLLKATGPTGVESYLHHDRLGSVVLQTHNNGTTVEVTGRAVYDPYGRPSTIPTWSTEALPLTVPYGYAGARRDDTVGLYLMGARWYDPTLGRFIEQDPIGESGGMNLYAYTASSPVMWTDPSGLAPFGVRIGSPGDKGGSFGSSFGLGHIGRIGHGQTPWINVKDVAVSGSGNHGDEGALGVIVGGPRDSWDKHHNPIPCYVCNDAEGPTSSDEAAADEIQEGANDDGEELGKLLAELVSMSGTADEVINAKRAKDASDPYSSALNGKQIGIFRGADLNELSGDQPLQANAERMVEVLTRFGAKVEYAPLSEETGNDPRNGGLDAALFFIHDFGGEAPLESQSNGKSDGWLTTGEVGSWSRGLVKDGGVALWVGCDTAEGSRNFVDSSSFNRFGYTGGTEGDVLYDRRQAGLYETETRARFGIGVPSAPHWSGLGAFPKNPWVWVGPVPGAP